MPRKVDTDNLFTNTFRLDTDRLGLEYTNSLIELFLKENDLLFSKYIISYELGSETGKGHYQGFIIHHIQSTGYQTRCSRYFSNYKSSEKSFAPVKKEFFKTYVCKDGNIKWSKGYSDEEIKDLCDQYDPNYARTVNANAKRQVQRSSTKKDRFNELVGQLTSKGVTHSSTGWEIAEAYLDVIQEGENPYEPNDFQIKCVIKSVQRHLIYSNATPEQLQRYKRLRAKDIIGGVWTDPVDFI